MTARAHCWWFVALAGQATLHDVAGATTAVGRFDVTVNLRAPDGCQFTTSAGTAGSPPVVTLSCPSNLFVGVQPTVIPTAASPAAAVGGGEISAGLFPGITSTSIEARPPTEAGAAVAALANVDTGISGRASSNGAMFVERRDVPAGSGGGTQGFTMLLASPDAGAAANTGLTANQPVEMWLIF
jgi:hypothetical protein